MKARTSIYLHCQTKGGGAGQAERKATEPKTTRRGGRLNSPATRGPLLLHARGGGGPAVASFIRLPSPNPTRPPDPPGWSIK